MPTFTPTSGTSVTQPSTTAGSAGGASSSSVAGMFQNPFDELNDELEERRKKAMAAGQVGSPGKISTMLGYSGMVTSNPLNLKPYG
jgi:hypothetical protein